MGAKLEKNTGPQVKLNPKPSAPAATRAKAPVKGKLGRDELSTGKGRALTLKAELAAAPRAKPGAKGKLAADELSTGQGRALRRANEKSLAPLPSGGNVPRQTLRELEASLRSPRANVKLTGPERVARAQEKLADARLEQISKRVRMAGAELGQLARTGKLTGAELAQLAKKGKLTASDLTPLFKQGRLSGAELAQLTKLGKLSAADLARLTPSPKLSSAELAHLTKLRKLSGAELAQLTKSGKFSAPELAALSTGKLLGSELAALRSGKVSPREQIALELKMLGPTAAGRSSFATDPTLTPAQRAAAEKVTEAYRTGGAEAAATELDRQVAVLSPSDAAVVWKAVGPTVDKIIAEIEPLGADEASQTITSLSEAAAHAGAAAITDLGGRFAKAIPDGSVGDWDNGFSATIAAGVGPEVALATADALRKMGKTEGAKDIEAAIVGGVDRLQGKVKDAAQEKAELETRLAQDMAAFGGSMDPAARKAYADAFWALPDHAAVKATADATSAALDHTMTVAGPRLEAIAKAGDPVAASVLLRSYEQLAKFPAYAEAAIVWAGKIGNDKKLFEMLSEANRFEHAFEDGPSLEERLTDGLMTDGTQALQQQLIAKYADDPNGQAALLADYKRIYAGFKDAKMFVDLGKEVGKFLDQTTQVIKDPDSIASIAAGWDEKSKFAKATAVASVVIGLYKTGTAIKDGEYLKAAAAALGTVDGGLGLTAGILAAYSGGAGQAADAAKFINKFAPALSVVVDAIQLGQDVGELLDDPNAGEIVKAIGSLISLAGNAFPLLGGVLKVGGGVIHFIGDLIDSFFEGNEKKDKLTKEQAELYAKATGLPFDVAKELVKTTPQTTERLKALGFTPKQIVELAQLQGVDLDSSEARTAIRTAALFGLDATETLEFIKMTINEGKYRSNGPLTEAAVVFGRPASTLDEGDQLYQDHDLSLVQDKILDQLSYDNPEVVAWLKAHQGPADYAVVFSGGVFED